MLVEPVSRSRKFRRSRPALPTNLILKTARVGTTPYQMISHLLGHNALVAPVMTRSFFPTVGQRCR